MTDDSRPRKTLPPPHSQVDDPLSRLSSGRLGGSNRAPPINTNENWKGEGGDSTVLAVRQLIAIQAEELSVRKDEVSVRLKELEVREKEKRLATDESKVMAELQAADFRDARIHKSAASRRRHALVGLTIVILGGALGYTLFLGQVDVVTEVVKALVFLCAGGAGGYGWRAAKEQREQLPNDEE